LQCAGGGIDHEPARREIEYRGIAPAAARTHSGP
jgi:hypothetical protein